MADPEVPIPEGFEDAGPVPPDLAIPVGFEDAGPVDPPLIPEGFEDAGPVPTGPVGPGLDVDLGTAPPINLGEEEFYREPEPGSGVVLPPEQQPEEVARRTRNAKILAAMDVSKSTELDKLRRASEIAVKLNVPVRNVLPNLDEFERTIEAAERDPDAWYRDNKLLADVMMDSTLTMASVMADPKVPPLIRAFRKVEDFYEENFGRGFREIEAMAKAGEKALEAGVPPEQRLDVVTKAADTATAEAEKQKNARRNAKEEKLDTPEARAIRDADSTTLTLQRRYREARAAMDFSNAAAKLALLESIDEKSPAAAEALAEAQNYRAASRPLLLDEDSMASQSGAIIQGLLSTTDNLAAQGVTGGLGYLAGVGVAAALKKPQGAHAAGMAVASKTRLVGSVLQGFRAELGGTYFDLREAKTDEGRTFTKPEALGGAVAYAFVGTILENIGLEAQISPLKARVRELMGRNPLFRKRLVELGKEWAKASLTEGSTEGLQSMAEQIISYAAKSLKDTDSLDKIAWQKGPVYNPEQALTEFSVGAVVGGGVHTTMSLPGLAVDLVQADKEALTSPRQVELTAALAEQESVKAAPGEFAKVVTRATGETGRPVTEWWVEAKEAQRLFQDAGKDDAQVELELREAGGESVVDSYKEAVATNGRFQVPLETVLGTWATSEIGKKLLKYTATSETAATPAQESSELDAIRAHAEEAAKKAIAEMEDESSFEDALEKMRRDIVETSRGLAGISNPQEYARDAVRLVRAVYVTARERNPTWTWKQTLQQMGLLEFAKGDEAAVGETRVLVKANDPHTDLRNVLDFGGRTGGQLDIEERAGLIFVDKLSHLRDQEAFDLEGLAEGEQVAMVTTPDAKAVNDHPDGSHPSTNALLRRMASVVQKVDPRAARIGPNFAVRVRDQSALDSFLAQLREVMPPGMQAVGALGATRAAAGKALDELVAKQRKDGLLPKRGGTAFDVSKLATTRLDEGVQLAPPAPLTDALLSAVDAEGKYEGREKLGNRAFLDAMVPGLLSGLGFDHVQKGKYTVALDLKRIRAVNMMLGKDVGDVMLRAFGEALVRNGGQAFSAAHLSGDEYVLTHDSKEALEEFIADLEADLRASAEVEYTLPDGKVLVVDVGFRWGLAEGDYGRADQDLNRRKLEEPAKRKVDPEDPNADPRELGRVREDDGGKPGDAARGDGGPEVEGRGSVQLREARALRRRGSERSRPFRDVAAEAAAESAGEGFGDGADERSAGLSAFASPEVLTEARAWVATLRSPARKARFNAWLDYAAGLRERPTGDLFLERGEGVELVDMFGGQLDDPNGTFFDTPFLQGIGPSDYTGPRRGAKRARRGEGDRSEAARNEARMADANRARGVLAPDATGRLLFQEGNRAAPLELRTKTPLGAEIPKALRVVDLGSDAAGSAVMLTQSHPKPGASVADAREFQRKVDELLALIRQPGEVRELLRFYSILEDVEGAVRRGAVGEALLLIDNAESQVEVEGDEQQQDDAVGAPGEQRGPDDLGALTDMLREVRGWRYKLVSESGDAGLVVESLSSVREGATAALTRLGVSTAEHAEALRVWGDQVEEQTGRMFQEDVPVKSLGEIRSDAEAAGIKPFVSNAERRRAFATDRELALKWNAVTPRGPLPEREGQAVQKVAVEAKRARKAAADTAADAILRGEKVRVDKTGRQPTIREVALALQRRQRAKHGVISERDFSQEAAEKISDWMAQEAAYEYEAEQRAVSGAGWYSERFQTALDLLSDAFPKLKEQKNRDLMTAIIAITSDGQAVGANLKQAVGVWQQYEATGSLAVNAYRPAITENLAVLDALMRQHGDGLTEFLLAESTVGEMKRQAAVLGTKFSSGYSAETVTPRSAVLFGPKLGAFFANLMGKTGYLTMDRWWSRTFARYRGTIVSEPTRSGLETLKKLLGDEEMDDDEALLAAAFAKHAYEDKDYKNGTPIEKAGNTIAKAAFLELKDRPGGAAQRDFMIRTAQMAVDKLKARGVDLTLADLQAVLWYFEKRLYSTLGARDSKEDSYEDAVAKLIIGGEIQQQDARGEADASGAADDAGPGRSAAQVDRRDDRRAEAGASQRVAPGEEGSPAGHAGRVDVERLYQREQSSAPKLSDGRSIIFDTTVGENAYEPEGRPGAPTVVAAIDLKATQAAIEALKEKWRNEGEPQAEVDQLNFALNRISQALNEGRLDYAEDMVKEAMVREAMLTAMQNDENLLEQYELGEDGEVYDLGVAMVENQRLQGPSPSFLGEYGERARREFPFTSALQPTLDALSKREFLTAARAGKLGLSPEDQQAFEVALDEFEQATGRMRQDEEKKAGAPPRGYFELGQKAPGVARVLKVFLNRRADRSTVFHESAHGFLEMYRNLQDAPDLADPTRKRWERILKWLKVESTEAWDKLGKAARTEKHERWAKAFELYNKEGRAPSKGLAGTMARMKRWLTRIYGTVANIDGVELDDEVRAIFDSMLATEKEIAAQAGRRGKPVFNTAEEAGMTEEEFAARQEEEREELSFATREAAAAATRAALRGAEQDYREQLESVRAEAEAEYDALPGRRAQLYLEGKAKDLLEVGVSMEPVVLDRRAVEEVVGGYGAKKFRTRNGAASPDDVAPLAGFTTGREMLQAVASLPSRAEWVEQRAKAMVEERDPANTADLERLRAEVADGVQRYTEQRIEREWDELGRRAEPGSDVSALGRQVALQALKKAARTITDKMRVGRLNPAAVLQKERHAARLVREAANKGNIDAARDWFRQQTLQVYTHRAVLDAIEERRRFLEMAERLAKKEARQRLGKADPRLRDAVDYLLGVFGLGPETELTGETLTAAAAVIEETGEVPGEWLQALQVPEFLGSGDAMNLTVAGLRHLDAALRQLYAIAKFRNEVMVGEKLVERELTVDEMAEQGVKVLPRKPPPVTKSTESTLETLSSLASSIEGYYLLNPADLLRDLTGDDTEGVWWKAIIEPLRRAKYQEAEHLKKLVEPITKAMEALPESVKRRMRETVDGRKLFPGHIDAVLPRQRHELLMMALNVGNPGNLQRLTDGRKISLDEVAKAIDLLTDAELAWVQTVWDAAGSLREESFALEERMTGLRPKGVEPEAFRLPSGRVLKGGYFPAVYDRRASVLGQKQAENELASLMDPRFARVGTPHSHLKARVERVEDAALSLDVTVIYRHLTQVAHDLAWREPIKSVGSLLLPGKRIVDGETRPDNRVMEVLRERIGVEKADTFMRWLKEVGGGAGSNVTPLDPYISAARSAFAHVILGWKASTALGDFANPVAALLSTKLKTKHLAAATLDFMKAPMVSRKKALEASPWLRTMVDTTRQQFDKAMKGMLDKQAPLPLRWYKDNAFFFMETVAAATSTPVWMGSYRQAIAEGADHDTAVRFADDVLSQAWPSHHPLDVAGILRDRGVLGMSVVMYGYLSVAYRSYHRITAPLREQAFLDAIMSEKAVTLAKVSGRLLGYTAAWAVLGELLMGRGAEAGDADDDDPDNKLLKWSRWFLRKMLVAPLSTIPLLPLDRQIEAKVLGKREPSPRTMPLLSMYEMLAKQFWTALDGDKGALERLLAVLKLLLESRGYPVAPLDVQGKYLLDVGLGEQQPEGPLDVVEGLSYGKKENQPENLFTAGRDIAGWVEEKLTGSD